MGGETGGQSSEEDVAMWGFIEMGPEPLWGHFIQSWGKPECLQPSPLCTPLPPVPNSLFAIPQTWFPHGPFLPAVPLDCSSPSAHTSCSQVSLRPWLNCQLVGETIRDCSTWGCPSPPYPISASFFCIAPTVVWQAVLLFINCLSPHLRLRIS